MVAREGMTTEGEREGERGREGGDRGWTNNGRRGVVHVACIATQDITAVFLPREKKKNRHGPSSHTLFHSQSYHAYRS